MTPCGKLLETLRERLGVTRVEQFAFLGLGSNLGDRLDYLQRAVNLLHADERTRVDAVSSVYETAPMGGPEQGPFLNIAVRVATRRTPLRLLALCQSVEARLGRVRDVRWGPRTIDVDILLYGDQTVSRPDLEIPHPRLADRPFALIPLIEVAPGQRLPATSAGPEQSLTSAVAKLAPIEDVTAIGSQVRHPDERSAGSPPSRTGRRA
jgi:2-amino-4-hydroxy-6-hydroxymethyldihydropteridine diphosphokinase